MTQTLIAASAATLAHVLPPFSVPPLPYLFEALSPTIDADAPEDDAA